MLRFLQRLWWRIWGRTRVFPFYGMKAPHLKPTHIISVYMQNIKSEIDKLQDAVGSLNAESWQGGERGTWLFVEMSGKRILLNGEFVWKLDLKFARVQPLYKSVDFAIIDEVKDSHLPECYPGALDDSLRKTIDEAVTKGFTDERSTS